MKALGILEFTLETEGVRRGRRRRGSKPYLSLARDKKLETRLVCRVVARILIKSSRDNVAANPNTGSTALKPN